MTSGNSGKRTASDNIGQKVVFSAVVTVLLAGMTLWFFHGPEQVQAETEKSRFARRASERADVARADVRVNDVSSSDALHAPRFSLDDVPAPGVPGAEELPAPATWPALRHDRRLRMLVIASFNSAVASYQRIARRCNADVDFRFYPRTGLSGGTGPSWQIMAHTNDQWIEGKKKPSPEEVTDRLLQQIREALAAAPDRYDVVFVSEVSEIINDQLLAYMRGGGVVVVTGKTYPQEGSELESLWPAAPHPKKRSWHHDGSERAEAPHLMGLPLQRLSAHQYMHHAQVADGADALATGASGAAFLQRVGDGTLLFVPTGPISRHPGAAANSLRRYDHDEIWLRYWDQLLHGVAGGASALPALADITHGPDEAPAGQDYPLQGMLHNRTDHAQTLMVSAHVVAPSGEVVYQGEPEKVDLAAGEERAWESTVPVGAFWPDGLHAAYLTVGDPEAEKRIHQAMRYIPVTGNVELELTADSEGYKIGEQATFTLEASSADAWEGEINFGVYDFRGRLLATQTQPATLDAEPTTLTFTWPFADHGVRVDTVWAVASAVRDGESWARAESKVYKHERWDMRNEYQWSTWPRFAGKATSVVPHAMQLMAHAGLNSLGYAAGGKELYYPAERWSWRKYGEGVGSNTWKPVIESVTDEEILAAQRESRKTLTWLESGTAVLASVGEEAGFKSGWGRTYYWDEPVAPEKACQAFQRFLQEKYPDLDTLNAAWKTNYEAWEEVKLTKEFSGKKPSLDADGWAAPTESPLGEDVERVSMMPYLDTREFYGWYYEKVIDAALKILREEINPVPLTMASAPFGKTFDPPNLDVRLAGSSNFRESQHWTLAANAPEPGFALVWGHYDWPVAAENVHWGHVIKRSGHNDYWVDVPLTFNADMTHTRASFAIRRWRHNTAHAERLLLDARPTRSEVAVLKSSNTNTQWMKRFAGRMYNSIRIALNQGGFGFADVDWDDLAKYKIIFAPFSSALSQEQARALNRYVEGGGTLVFGQRFATHNQHRVALETSPGHGLAEQWGLTVTEKNERIPRTDRADRKKVTANLDALGPDFAGLKLESPGPLNEKVQADGWTRLAQYSDDVPALLTRKLDQGTLVYLNAGYWTHKYIQWVTDTGPRRQAFYRLIEHLGTQAGARRAFRIDGNFSETLHMAAMDWTDPSGEIGYAVVRTNGQTVWTSGKLFWLGPQTACYDVYGGDPKRPAPVYGKEVDLHLRPGAGRLLAFTDRPIADVKVRAPAQGLTPGEPLRVEVEMLDAEGKPVPGAFPLDVRVRSGEREIPGLRRDLSLESGEALTLATALDDPAGRWTVSVREGISRRVGTTTIDVAAPPESETSPGLRAWGQPSELWEAERMPTQEFVAKLEQLATVYHREPGDETWMIKQWLGAYYSYFSDTRHALLRDLWRVDWREYAEALRSAVEGGADLILVGEDLGLDPATGLPVSPYQEATQLAAVAEAMKGATWSGLSGDGEVIHAKLGRGSLVLSRLTPDGASSSWSYARFWLKHLQQMLAAAPAHPEVPAPNAQDLRRWLSGEAALVKGPRTVVWQGGWEDEVGRRPVWKDAWKQSFDPGKQTTGPVFVLRLPPTGDVEQATVDLAVKNDAPVMIDIGASASVDGNADDAGAMPWAQAINDHLAWRERECGGVERDLNGWRLVPIRFRSDAPFNVRMNSVKLTIQ